MLATGAIDTFEIDKRELSSFFLTSDDSKCTATATTAFIGESQLIDYLAHFTATLYTTTHDDRYRGKSVGLSSFDGLTVTRENRPGSLECLDRLGSVTDKSETKTWMTSGCSLAFYIFHYCEFYCRIYQSFTLRIILFVQYSSGVNNFFIISF